MWLPYPEAYLIPFWRTKMSKTVKRTEQDSVMTKIARSAKKSVFRSQQQQRDKHVFRAHAQQLVAGVEYL